MLLLAFELVVTRYMTLENVGRDATVVPDKLVAQSGTGKLGLRLRSDRLLRPSVHGDEQCAARQSDLDSASFSTVNPLVDAGIFRQDFGSHVHRGFLSVRCPADPVLLPVVRTFVADGFHHFRVGSQPRAEFECPGLVVSLGIIKRHCYFHVAEIGAPEAFRHAQRFCMGIASKEPCPIVVSVALHHQRVSFPVAYRISHPGRVGIRLQGAAVHVDLAVSQVFLQDDDHRGSLKDFLHTLSGAVVRTVGQTFVTWVIDAEVFSALPNQGLRPRLNVGGLQVPGFAERDIADGAIGADHLPQTREIELAIGGARRLDGEVRFAIGGARDARRAAFQPLRLERPCQGSQEDHGCEDLHRLEYLPLPPTIRLRRSGWYGGRGWTDMPKIVDRAKGQTMFRYRQHEMSGPLPPLLYKYLPLQYAHALIEKGEMTPFG